MPLDQFQIQNRLLKAMPSMCFAALADQLELVDLPLGHVLVEPDLPTTRVFFLEGGLGSIVATASDGERTEVGHVGYERMSEPTSC
jgi:CRP-like cAMP-binding protein